MKNTLLLISSLSLSAASFAQNEDTLTDTSAKLDTIKVSADFRQLDLMQIPSAITVVDAQAIENRNADHLESILSLAPNVNFAAGSSRGRYFQIRGIGERSQFIDPVNPSVGLIIDGIDMTGLGGAATLFDIEQVEILRGPQGTAFGANALAGAINIKSKQPTKETQGHIELKAGNYHTQKFGYSVSGPLSDNIQGRFSSSQTYSNGYMNNVHLNRKDTNNLNENVSRTQLNWQPNLDTELSVSILKADIKNGYDAFSLDNTRDTYSDNPGQDNQKTSASALKLTSNSNSNFTLEATTSKSDSDILYTYDDDWSFGEYDENGTGNCISTNNNCLETAANSYGYSAIDEYIRNHQRSNIDIRLLSTPDSRVFNNSTNWTVGIYNLDRDESLNRNYKYLSSPFNSDLSQNSLAVYTELTTQLSSLTSLSYGLRTEEWTNQYSNSNNLNSSKSETLWGGKIILESLINPNHLAYGSISRGYKAGGVNSSTDISEDKRNFDTEINNTLELGLKSTTLNDNLETKISAFYIERKDQQVKSSYSKNTTPPSFQEFIANAAEGENYGVEIESNWKLSNHLIWQLSAGYLKTKFTDYSYTDKDNNTVNKDGRAQAHAPEYSIGTSINITLNEAISFQIEAEAKDEFYFSDSHDEKSDQYQLLHASIQYQTQNLKLSLNGHNLTDKDYAVRGYFFGNDPRFNSDNENYVDTNYTQLSAPRLISVAARYDF
jgi:outer membrane receptor protein involved in Fe transport